MLLFAEFIPMFAGRFYSGAVIRAGITPLYIASKICAPWVFLVEKLCYLIDRCFGKTARAAPYLSREELQKAFELWGEGTNGEVSRISKAIFELEKKQASEIMRPIHEMVTLHEQGRISDLKNLLREQLHSFIPLVDQKSGLVLGIVYPRDLLRLADSALLRPIAHPPYFVPGNTPFHKLLHALRQSNQRVAVVLGEGGGAIGFITLDDLLLCIGQFEREGLMDGNTVYVYRSFPRHQKVEKVNQLCGIELPLHEKTLEGLLINELGHYPARGEGIKLGNIELVLDENGRKIIVRTTGCE